MNTAKHSRKFSLFVAVFVLAAGIFIGGYIVLKSNRGAASQLGNILAGKSFTAGDCNPDPNNSEKDSDNDGLKDWQEMQVFRADPCKQDSDGDGYSDGEETASGYDPTKKAPDDALPNSKNPRPLPSNLTTALHQKLSEQITQNKIRAFNAQGELLSSDQLQNFPAIQSSIREIIGSQTALFAPDKIEDNQIKTTADNSRAAIQAYAGAAAGAFPEIKDVIGDGAALLQVVENNNFAAIDANLTIYKESYEKLKTVVVPSALLELHKKQLNIISGIIKTYQAVRDIDSDPLKANLALQNYPNIQTQLNEWLKEFGDFLRAH